MEKHQEHLLLAPQNHSTKHFPKEIQNGIKDFSKESLFQAYLDQGKYSMGLHQLLNFTTEISLILDSKGRLRFFNTAAQDFFSLISEQPLQLESELLSGIQDEFRSTWEKLWAKVLQEERLEEGLMIQLEDKRLHFQLRYFKQTQLEEELHYLLLAEREDSAQTSEGQDDRHLMFESIINSVQEAIFRSSREDGIIYVNQAFARIFGYDTVEEILALSPSDLYMDPSRRDDFVRIVQEKGSFFNEEVEFRRKDGSGFWGLISSVPFYDKEGKRYHDGAIRDVTQLKEVERGLKENYAELEKVNRELDRFVYSTSHDLRAPLVSVAGLINITREEKDEQLRLKYLGLMDKSIQKLDDFIQDIIGYSRNSRLEPKSEPIDFQQLVEDAVQALRPDPKAQRFEIDIKVEAKQEFYSDSSRLNMIFNNLLSNAFRYSHPKKEHAHIEISVKHDQEQAFIRIKDNGIGIAKKYQEKVFQMFYRASQQSQGSGIGLYIVNEAVEKLKGKIHLQSSEGEGTEFSLSIPASKAKVQESA
ncbi:MAG: PAS domain-containing sensor histidine kinase [Bacteroidota bacterium]